MTMMRMLPIMVLAALLPAAGWSQPSANPNYNPPPPKEGYSYPDCYCTDSKGRRVNLGRTVCLSIGSKRVLARCEMSVNNPAWRYLSESCPGV